MPPPLGSEFDLSTLNLGLLNATLDAIVIVDSAHKMPSVLGLRRRGFGLTNMQRRADELGGSFSIESPTTGGTVMTWVVPVDGVAEVRAS